MAELKSIAMKLDDQSDEWLMSLVRQGRRECLEVLVRRYGGPLITYARRFLGDAHLAEEVFQDVFLAVWSKRAQFKSARLFRPWVFAITANKCREYYRRTRRRAGEIEMGEAHQPTDEDRGPEATAVQGERAVQVNAALQSLSEQQRAVVVMRVWNGFSYAEIASALNAKEGTVRAAMHRALARLKPSLEALCND